MRSSIGVPALVAEVYRYAGDKKPGQWLGQNVAAKWFVINPDGTKNLTCLPKAAVGGIATFTGCSIDKAGSYRLTASSGTLATAVTAS